MDQTRGGADPRMEAWPPQERSQDRRTVTVIRNDCGEKMMSDAARKACIALDCSDENDPDRKQDLATSLKASFDRDHEGTWNAVVGSDFGASITHELSRIIFFAIEAEPYREGQSIYILLFQQTESSTSEAGAEEVGTVAASNSLSSSAAASHSQQMQASPHQQQQQQQPQSVGVQLHHSQHHQEGQRRQHQYPTHQHQSRGNGGNTHSEGGVQGRDGEVERPLGY